MEDSKPSCANSAEIRSIVNVTGCRPPLAAPLPGNVISTASAESFSASAALPKINRRSSISACTACLTLLTAWPAAGFSSTGNAPIDFSTPVNRPFLPNISTRTASSSSRDDALPLNWAASSIKLSRSSDKSCVIVRISHSYRLAPVS